MSRVSRRDFLRVGAGVAVGAAGSALLGLPSRTAPAAATPASAASYGHGAEPPAGLGPRALDGALLPPPPRLGRVK